MSTPTVTRLAHLQAALSPALLNVVLSAAATVTTAEQPLPVEASRTGSIFTDRFDPALRWYLPTYALPAVDPTFAFAASQTVASDSELPLALATLTFTVACSEPADVVAARAADASLTFQPIPLIGLQVNLTCPAKDSSGADHPVIIPLATTTADDGSLVATAQLTGPTAVVAYQGLAHGTDSVVQVSGSYSVWRQWQRLRLPPIVVHGVPFHVDGPVSTVPVQLRARTLAPQLARLPIGHGPVVRLPVDPPDPVPTPPIDPDPNWVTAVDPVSDSLPATGFGTDAFRSRFTIEIDGVTRPIIDASDLTSFAQQRSLFRELTSLGDISTRYPTLRRVYLDQASGAVVAIPQSYGIVRGSDGLAALLEAVADDSAASVSGCRFEFSFTLAPLVDPVDLAQLAHDLVNAPEAATLTLQLGLPDSLDARFPSTFTGFQGGASTVGDGALASTVQVHIAIADIASTPAICNANLFLHQLANTVSPMTGTLALRLDDTYPTPVETSFVLGLDSTHGTDDISLTVATDDATSVVARNVGPFDLQLVRAAALTVDGPQSESIGTPLAPDATTELAALDSTAVTVVDTELALPDPLPPGGVFDYVTVHTETVTSVHHSLLYSASFDFTTAGVTQLDISASLVDLPAVVISSVTLTALHTTDSVAAIVPIDALVTGLSANVHVQISLADGSARALDLVHDFVADPLLTLTSASVAG